MVESINNITSKQIREALQQNNDSTHQLYAATERQVLEAALRLQILHPADQLNKPAGRNRFINQRIRQIYQENSDLADQYQNKKPDNLDQLMADILHRQRRSKYDLFRRIRAGDGITASYIKPDGMIDINGLKETEPFVENPSLAAKLDYLKDFQLSTRHPWRKQAIEAVDLEAITVSLETTAEVVEKNHLGIAEPVNKPSVKLSHSLADRLMIPVRIAAITVAINGAAGLLSNAASIYAWGNETKTPTSTAVKKTATPTPVLTKTSTPHPTKTPTAGPTEIKKTPTKVPTLTPTEVKKTPIPTKTPTRVPERSPTPTKEVESPTSTPTQEVETPTLTPTEVKKTATPTQTSAPEFSPTPTATVAVSPTLTSTMTPPAEGSPTLTPTSTTTRTASPSPTSTPTLTQTPRPEAPPAQPPASPTPTETQIIPVVAETPPPTAVLVGQPPKLPKAGENGQLFNLLQVIGGSAALVGDRLRRLSLKKINIPKT